MREISGGLEPQALVEWRLKTPGLTYNDVPSNLRDSVKRDLLTEQRELCGYTGLRIRMDSSHIEHLIPQDYCSDNQDVAYANMVACYPGPGEFAPFGAVRKRNWPTPAEGHLVVSPRSQGCEARFAFSLRGTITAAQDKDDAAKTTIQKLRLDHDALNRYRKQVIDATLASHNKGPASLDLKSARKRLHQLEQAEVVPGRLEQFCFVLKQALRKHIARLEAIRRSKAKKK
jgi:uncharacterized protein (TIGR02646 family)